MVMYPFAPNLYSQKSCFSLTPPSSATSYRPLEVYVVHQLTTIGWKNKLYMLKKLMYFIVWLLLSVGILQEFGIVVC